MKRDYELSGYLYLIALALTSGAGALTLIKNLKAGTYDINQDSIGLPFGVTLIIFLTLSLMHLLQVFLIRRARANSFAGLLLKISAYLIATISLVILVDRVVYWSTPHHAVIAILYGVTAITFAVFQIQTLVRLK